jgi:hypothetical protein
MLDTHERMADSSSPFALVRGRFDRFFATPLPARPSLQFAFARTLFVGGLFVGRPPFSPPMIQPNLFLRN